MRVVDEELKLAVQGVMCVIFGIAVFWVLMNFSSVHYFCVSGANKLLFIPEYPFTAARDLIKYSSNWMLERDSLRKRLSKTEAQNRVLSEALQKAQTPVPAARSSYVSARVTLRYPEEWWREIRIDKGRADKIKPGAAVMSDGYLVGRVIRVEEHSSWVELITSSSFLIAALVEETRDLGVVTGDNKGNLVLQYIADDRSITKEMRVSTSLIDDQIPPGLMIGTVMGKGEVREGYVVIKLKAGAHMTQLYTVEVYVEDA